MKKVLLFVFSWTNVLIYGQTITRSKLPIVSINTNGRTIPDEPKITATMQIRWREDGSFNEITDPPTHYDGFIGIEMRGSTSQFISPKKPYSIETRDVLGNALDLALLKMPKENDWSLIAPYSDKSLIRDALTYHLAAAFMPYAPRIRFCDVLLNGQYQGVYTMTEKIKRDKNRVDISKLDSLNFVGDALTGGYILKIDKTTGAQPTTLGFLSQYISGTQNARTNYLFHYPDPENIKPAQVNYIKGVINEFETVMQGSNYQDPINGYSKYIDIPSFIDFLLINELTKNVDGYRLSSYLYKDKNSINPRLKMGPVWDFNIALGNADYCQGGNTTGWAYNFNTACPQDGFQIPFYWSKLIADPNFKGKIRARWKQLRQNELANTKINNTVDSLNNMLSLSASYNFSRWNILSTYVWPNNYVGGSYVAEINYLKTWLTNRIIWLDGQFEAFPVSNNDIITTDVKIFPNPSDIGFRFYYELKNKADIKLLIYNNLGQLISEKNVLQEAGNHELYWHENVPKGLYNYILKTNNNEAKNGKIIVK